MLLLAAVLWWAAVLPSPAHAGPGSSAPYTSALDNGIIRVGIDANAGGVISYLSPSNSSTNLINTYDLGREVQQSYYAGDQIDRTAEGQHRDWSPWAWNPIGAGDSYGNTTRVESLEITPSTIHVKSRPLLWDMNNELCECTMRTWITLEGGRVRVHNRLNVWRTDTRWTVMARAQELPAAYPIADLPRVVSYTGGTPFTGGPTSEIPKPAMGWIANWMTREHWAACVNQGNWGVGVYTPGRSKFSGGLYGGPGGGTDSVNSCFLSPIEPVPLDRTTRFDYDYWLAVGNVDTIRQQFYEARQAAFSPPAGFPSGDGQVWNFNSNGDFGGWRPAANITGSSVINGRLEAVATSVDPQFHSPPFAKPARNWNVTVRLRNGTPSSTAQLFFTNSEFEMWSESKSKRINIVPNSPFRDYTFDMSDVPTWRGAIEHVRLDPVEAAGSFAIDWIRIGSD